MPKECISHGIPRGLCSALNYTMGFNTDLLKNKVHTSSLCTHNMQHALYLSLQQNLTINCKGRYCYAHFNERTELT